MQESKKHIENSVRCYQNLLEHVETFKDSIEKGILSAKELTAFNNKLVELQASVEQADKVFANHFDNKMDTIIADSLLAQKQSMMKEIQEINNYLLPRLASLMDITRDELNHLKKNVRTIHGYHSGNSPKSSTGRIIRKSC